MTAYDALRDERLATLVERRLRERGLGDEFKVGKLELKNDALKNQWKGEIEAMHEYDKELRTKLLPAFEKAIFQRDTSDVFVFAISIDVQMPVALSGGASFYAKNKNLERRVDQLIGIIPNKGSTIFTFGAHASDKDFIEAYISTWMKNAFGMLSMVESWMVNGSDQWYLQPSIWDALPEKRKSAILCALRACEQNIGEEYELSIFDGLRREFLGQLAAQEESHDEKYLEFVKTQHDKMI